MLLRLKRTKSKKKKKKILSLGGKRSSPMLRKRKRPTRPEGKKIDVAVSLPACRRSPRRRRAFTAGRVAPTKQSRFQTGQRGAEKGAAGGVLLQAARSAGSPRSRHMMQGERRGESARPVLAAAAVFEGWRRSTNLPVQITGPCLQPFSALVSFVQVTC